MEESLPMLLLRAREAAMVKFRPLLRDHGLTEQQWRVLRVLATGKPLDAGELAERSTLLGPSLTRIIKSLERDGLVRRSLDPADQRRAVIALTQSGQDKYHQVSPNSEHLYQEIEQQFGAKNLKHLNQLLNQLVTDLEQGTIDVKR